MHKIDDTLSVATPEGVRLHGVLAEPASRAKALMIDLAAMVGIFMVLLFLLSLLLLSLLPSQVVEGLLSVVFFFLFWGYFFFSEWWFDGVTLGKRCCGLKVVSADLSPMSTMQCAWRNVLRYLDMLPGCFGIGLFVLLISPKNQRLGDWMAGTVVIYRKPPLPRQMPISDGASEPPPWHLRPAEARTVMAFAAYADTHHLARAAELSAPLAPLLKGDEDLARVARLQRWGRWLSGVQSGQSHA